MIYVLSIMGVLLENSLAFSAFVLIVTLPFCTYLIYEKPRFYNLYLILVILIISLQTDNYVFYMILLLIYLIVLSLTTNFIRYSGLQTLYFSVYQIAFYSLFSFGSINIKYMIFNFIGFLFLNYFYSRITNKEAL